MDLPARQPKNRGYSDATARGFEIALVPLVFGGLGWWLDGVFGTGKIITISLAVFAVVGTFIKFWIGYDREMRQLESEGVWNKVPKASSGLTVEDVA